MDCNRSCYSVRPIGKPNLTRCVFREKALTMKTILSTFAILGLSACNVGGDELSTTTQSLNDHCPNTVFVNGTIYNSVPELVANACDGALDYSSCNSYFEATASFTTPYCVDGTFQSTAAPVLPSTPEASLCGDGIDNDGDGLTDCDDPDCNDLQPLGPDHIPTNECSPAPPQGSAVDCPNTVFVNGTIYNASLNLVANSCQSSFGSSGGYAACPLTYFEELGNHAQPSCHPGGYFVPANSTTPPAPPVCSFDSDCLSSERCLDGACITAPLPPAGSCQDDDDCIIGQFCQPVPHSSYGVCINRPLPPQGQCWNDRNCEVNEVCVVDGLTSEPGICSAAPLLGSELNLCGDGIDNDGDGLTDCSDPDCYDLQPLGPDHIPTNECSPQPPLGAVVDCPNTVFTNGTIYNSSLILVANTCETSFFGAVDYSTCPLTYFESLGTHAQPSCHPNGYFIPGASQ